MYRDRQGRLGERERDETTDAARLVAGTGRAEGIVAIAVLASCFGLPLLSGLLHGRPVLGIANALLLGLVGWGILLLLNLLVLQPARLLRMSGVADQLSRAVRCPETQTALHRSWIDGEPGAITTARDGRVWLADRSTAYRPITLDRSAILTAEVVATGPAPMALPRAPTIALGVPLGGGLIAAISPVRRQRPAPPARVGVALRYQACDVVRHTVIPFGTDLDGAQALAALLRPSGPQARAANQLA